MKLTGDLLVSSLEEHHVEEFLFGPGGLRAEHLDYRGHTRPPISASSANAALARMGRFFHYCQRKGLTRRDLTGDIMSLKAPKKLQVRPAPDVMLAMLDSCEEPRDRALMAVALNTAVRASTIKAARVGDLNLIEGGFRVELVKTKDEKVLPVTADLDREMRKWLTTYAENLGRPLRSTDFLVPARNNGRFYWVTHEDGSRECLRTAIEYLPHKPMAKMEEVIQRAYTAVVGGDIKGIGIHTIRRGVARALFDQLQEEGGYDHAIRVVSALLGHKQAGTTELYLGTSSEERKLDRVMRGRDFLTAMVPAADADNVVQLRAAQ
ncbi:tyrosine-type recombinase/integrase [Fodinicola feengrottensis]|uniref:tyrosine-type recombinase/integrase n=1 Tax=Fodinicola feengrottensis TaxID=435914 RepID=UPI0013D17129|nr:site-specific integrase [Fodinicola feengrottensis]